MSDYKNSNSARNKMVGEAGNVNGYSNGLPGLIKRVEGLISRLLKIETDIGDVEEIKVPTADHEVVEGLNSLYYYMGEYQMDLIYENTSPGQPYGETTIPLGNDTGYDEIIIITTDGHSLAFKKGNKCYMGYTVVTTVFATVFMYRNLNFSGIANNNLTISIARFRECQRDGTTRDGTSTNALVPYKIFGIRRAK